MPRWPPPSPPRTPRAPSPCLASRVVGYLLGAPKGGAAWGPNVWVEAAGHAVEEVETARALYAVAATRWVEEGRTAHYALLPAYDTALIGAWFRLAFGHQHTHAIREPAAAGPVPGGPRSCVSPNARRSRCWRGSTWCSPTTRPSRRRSPRARPTSTRSEWRTGRRTSTTRSSGTSSSSTRARSSAAQWAARWKCRRATPGSARPDRRGVPGFRRGLPRGARPRRRAGCRRGGVGLGAVRGLPQHRHRLAGDQSALVTGLAGAGLPRHLHPRAPARRVH